MKSIPRLTVRKDVIVLQDNATTHITLMSREMFQLSLDVFTDASSSAILNLQKVMFRGLYRLFQQTKIILVTAKRVSKSSLVGNLNISKRELWRCLKHCKNLSGITENIFSEVQLMFCIITRMKYTHTGTHTDTDTHTHTHTHIDR